MNAAAVVMLFALSAIAADDAPMISPATNENGILIHDVQSKFRAGATQIRVLLPDARKPGQKYPAIYVLPVEARSEARYGDGLSEVKKLDLQNKYQAVFVAPTFSHLPWYADHPTDATIRQESYFIKVVVPFVEKTYPVTSTSEGRLLLGFSKSGWGAYSLLLRHSQLFGRAAAWDAPLMMDQLGKYGTSPIFGTQDNFEKYRVTNLLRSRAKELLASKRLVLTGYGNFRREHEQFHSLLEDLKIPHDYRDGPQRQHDWHSGWVEEAVSLLMNIGTQKQEATTGP